MNLCITLSIITICSVFFLNTISLAVPITYSLSGEITVSQGSGYAQSLEDYVYLHDGDLFSGTIVYDNEFGVYSLEFNVNNDFGTFFQSIYMYQSPSPMIYLANFNISPIADNIVVTDSNLLEFSWDEDWLPDDINGLKANGGVELYPNHTSISNIFFANFTFTVGQPIPVPEPSSFMLFSISFLCFFRKVDKKVII